MTDAGAAKGQTGGKPIDRVTTILTLACVLTIGTGVASNLLSWPQGYVELTRAALYGTWGAYTLSFSSGSTWRRVFFAAMATWALILAAIGLWEITGH